MRADQRTIAGFAAVTLVASALFVGSGMGSTALALPPGAAPSPVAAVRAIVDALARHHVVAIGESHNLQEAGRFYDRLVRSDRFASLVDDVVVEFGNARYQSTVDRYVRGGDVPAGHLRRVWQDTTQVGAWDAPMYRDFFAAARSANLDRDPADRIRILLADPPIDWSVASTKEDVEASLLRRERFMARLIEREVLETGDRAVLISGLAHVERAATTPEHPDVTQIIDRRFPGQTWVVGLHLGFPVQEWEDALAPWPIPSIAALEGTWIGQLPKADGLAQDALDAMLYVGAPDALHLSIPLPSVYVRGDYWQTLKERWSLGVGGSFSAANLFGAYGDARYPGLFSKAEIEALEAFAECMRTNGVESFPDPQFQYDSAGFFGSALDEAHRDPDFRDAFTTCAPMLNSS